jgi:thiamine pyrophosphate-dependent acetolactate synthase large subunit-like protein
VVCVSDTGAALPHGYSARLYAHASPSAAFTRLTESAPRFASTWTADELSQLQRRFIGATPTDPPEPVVEGATPAAFFATLRAALPRDAVLVTDSGLHQVLARRYYTVLSPRGFLYPSDLQSMGFGLPAALGAKLAAPSRAVVVVMGDGGLAMTGLELLTAVREKLPVVVVVLNDGQLNLIRLQQLKEFGRASGVELLVPDLELLAQAIGARYSTAANDLSKAVAAALEEQGPTLIEVAVGDSRTIAGVRAKSLARETVRKLAGPTVVGWLKRLR